VSYSYATERDRLFTEDGQKLFLQIRDTVTRLLANAEAFRSDKAWKGCSGDSWQFLAALDRLVELGEIRELTPAGTVAGQHRVFVRGTLAVPEGS
jgi:hypothetical protein